MPAVSVRFVGIDRQPMSDARYLLEPPPVLPEAPPSPPPQSFVAHCGSVGFRVAHFEDLFFEEADAWCEAPELLCFADDLPEPDVLDSLLLLPIEVEEVPLPDMEPEPPSLLVVPEAELLRLPEVPVLLVPFIEELLPDGFVVLLEPLLP
jgi:hypothetical protein